VTRRVPRIACAMRGETPVADHEPRARRCAVADARPNSAEQEAELARRFRNGDPAALRAAYDRHGRAVFALALLALEAHHNAEDVMRLAGAGDVRSRARRRGRLAGGITRREIADRLHAPSPRGQQRAVVRWLTTYPAADFGLHRPAG
jgi:hypothetical protein